MAAPNRRAGYWNRERETMSAGAREDYQLRWLSRLLTLAWERAPGVRRRLEHAKLAPAEFRSTDDLARLPVIKKSAMPELQKADPPFGGFCTEPMTRLRKIFVSP
jgi:phenylacetate-CoA ligase